MDIKLACTHEHSLTYDYAYRIEGRQCEVCGKEILISGNNYICQRCEVLLHESCAYQLQHLPHEIIHPLHSHHQLKLQLDCSWIFICDKCLYISIGYRYRCTNCDFNLDLTCASSVNDPLSEEEWCGFRDGQKKTIRHYFHIDKLILFKYKKIKEDDYNCSGCEKSLLDSDVCYGCIGHELFLHEVCIDKIPRKLNHPFHPSHPLRLNYLRLGNYCHACKVEISTLTRNSAGYGCEICNFRLDFHCSKLSPTLKHKCHNHPLTYFGENIRANDRRKHFQCNVCRMLCDANFFRCVQCDINFHPQCIPIPSSIKHKYHRHSLIFMDSVKEDDSEEYYCDVCENERNPNHPVFCCKKCTYIAHIECTLHEDNISSKGVPSTAVPSIDSKAFIVKEMEDDEVTDGIHSSQKSLFRPLIHEHSMKFCAVDENLKENLYCNGCCFKLSGPSYICTKCPRQFPKDYYLHEKCANLPYEMQHTFHSSHPLNLYASSYRPIGIGSYIICDECRDIALGFIYLCEKCNFKLDVKCACALTVVSQLKDQVERETELHDINHPHKLILGNSSPRDGIKCTMCELPILGPAYLCRGLYCHYIVHESCLGLLQELQVPFHPEHKLVFDFHPYNRRYSRCYACHLDFEDYRGARYCCEQCQIKNHYICANSLRRPIKHECHMHNLYYFGPDCQLLFEKYWYEAALFCCYECQESCRGRPFYRCLQCAINFHLECVPIPYIFKSKCHIHALVLKDSFVEDASGEYYCEVCEKERCQNDLVYCCEECNNLFVAHMECVLVKVENVLSYLDRRDRKKSPIINEIANAPSESD